MASSLSTDHHLVRTLFLPTARQTNWLLIVAFLSVGEAMYLRYMAIENLNVELACQAGLKSWLCTVFHVSIALYNHYVFGGAAVAAALLNLLRPSIVLVAVALAADRRMPNAIAKLDVDARGERLFAL